MPILGLSMTKSMHLSMYCIVPSVRKPAIFNVPPVYVLILLTFLTKKLDPEHFSTSLKNKNNDDLVQLQLFICICRGN
jgi:hypothetical protein